MATKAPTKIYLLDLAHTHSVENSGMLVPLGVAYIKAYAEEMLGDDVEIKIFKHPQAVLDNVLKDRPEIIGFANYVWNRQLNLTIGQYLKSVLPDALYVAGGPNIDIDAEGRVKFFKKYDFLDYVITNSGEEPFRQLIEWHRTGQRQQENLPNNLVWFDGETLRTTPELPATKHVDNIPSPYLRGDLDEFLDMGMIPLFETNRGCPFKCSFCVWGMSAQNLVRRFELDTVFEEIEYVGQRSDAVYWIVCDANFGMLKRDVEIAKAIRKVKDERGRPHKCHVWLAKNATERNLVIADILEDMVHPVMAVQSLDEEVLKNIDRDNISLDTYVAYQQKFHDMGSITYSDVIIPLPGETLKSHLDGVQTLFEMGVDRIQNHNLWLLPGSSINTRETWEKYGFRTRRRLIHGDEGVYKGPNGEEIRVFEYEESLRETTTISEEEMFYLRKYHFLVDFCWSSNVYRPLLEFCLSHDVSPNTVFEKMIGIPDAPGNLDPETRELMTTFWGDFDERSYDEWFDTDEEIETYFADDRNFERLMNQEFEKLHILFSIVIFRDYKTAFDRAIGEVAKSLLPENEGEFVDDLMEVVNKAFPPLDCQSGEQIIVPSDQLVAHSWFESNGSSHAAGDGQGVRFLEGEKRRLAKNAILNSQGKTISKVLNTNNLSVRELQYEIDVDYGLGRQFKDRLYLQ
jgi:radical SAM superfamily enzyme YgiQ (UPF0313 family)